MKKRSKLEEIAIGVLTLATATLAGGFIYHSGSKDFFMDDNQASIYKEEMPAQKEISYKTANFSIDSDTILLARMIFGEARGCSNLEKVAVAYTAINRANDGKKWNGEILKEVILKRWQYSCFNKNDINRKKIEDPERYDSKSWKICLKIAEDVLSKKVKDPTPGATHYFNSKLVSSYPDWANKLTKVGKIQTETGLSEHEFYIEY